MRPVQAGDVMLAVSDRGSGEPVVFIQTALMADELLPLADAPALTRDYRRIVYHRRGYGTSSPADLPGSIVRDTEDLRSLLDALAIDRAHVVGFSYSGAVALQFAADAPERTHSLVAIEPPPVHVPSAGEFRAANDRLLELRQRQGHDAAVDALLTMVFGGDWREAADASVPGAAAHAERDAATLFDVDLPALLHWRFGAQDAARIRCPALHIGGTDSGPWFAQVRMQVLTWLPGADDAVIDGAGHALALTHTAEVAEALAGFLRRHPM
jgi:pimeloyl-ACP methyl ester carboxylesterase